jgi:capsule polysaccharide export protein KpsE/RkpR
MNKVKSAWSRLQTDPSIMKSFNGWSVIFWTIMVPISFVFGWISSVTYVSALSLVALILGSLSAWASNRVEVEQITGTTLNDEDREWFIALLNKEK